MVRIPLEYSRLRQTGEVAIFPRLELLVRASIGNFAALEFLLDTGANFTTIPLAEARRLQLAVPPRTITLEVRTAAGMVRQQVHPGRISVQVPGLQGHTFTWPCHFVDTPGQAAPVALLGLSGVLNDLRLTFDGTYALDARYGVLLLEQRANP